MPSNQIMIIAGEPSGDNLAADVVHEMMRRARHGIRPRFFGLGGPRLAAAGVELLEDMTQHTVFGLYEVLQRYQSFKKIFDRALQEAKKRQPELVILVDYGGFNLRFAQALRTATAQASHDFGNWNPKIAYFIPPQVWASREGRAITMGECIDLVISIFPFEREWYRQRVPHLKVKYVGDPMATRFGTTPTSARVESKSTLNHPRRLAILPGSRRQEIERHLPPMLEALKTLQRHEDWTATIVTPDTALLAPYKSLAPPNVTWTEGSVEPVLRDADLALVSSGTVTRECAYLGVPTVVIYKLSWMTYQIAKRIIKVRFIAMPNLLADRMIFPELIQAAATPTAIAQELLQLCKTEDRLRVIDELEKVILSLGPPGAAARAAAELYALFERGPASLRGATSTKALPPQTEP